MRIVHVPLIMLVSAHEYVKEFKFELRVAERVPIVIHPGSEVVKVKEYKEPLTVPVMFAGGIPEEIVAVQLPEAVDPV